MVNYKVEINGDQNYVERKAPKNVTVGYEAMAVTLIIKTINDMLLKKKDGKDKSKQFRKMILNILNHEGFWDEEYKEMS